MIRLILLIITILVSLLMGCKSTRSAYLPKYSKQVTYFYPDGKINILTLSKDFKIAGIKYKEGKSIIVGKDRSVSLYKQFSHEDKSDI